MKHSDTLGALATALAAVQAELRPAAMNAKNPHLRNKYADLGAIIESSRPSLTKHGIAVSQMLGGEPGQVSVETVVMHKSGEWMSSIATFPVVEQKGITTAQAAGISFTYLRRYSMAAALGIYADEDVDGHMPAAPAEPARPADPPLEKNQLTRIAMLAGELDIDRDQKLKVARWAAGRDDLASTKELTAPQAVVMIEAMVSQLAKKKDQS